MNGRVQAVLEGASPGGSLGGIRPAADRLMMELFRGQSKGPPHPTGNSSFSLSLCVSVARAS
jgi:hypothetical protein